MEDSRSPGVALRAYGESVQAVQGSRVLAVIPAHAVRRSAVLGAIVRQQGERYTSLDPQQISDWIQFPDILPSQQSDLVALLKARSLHLAMLNRNSRGVHTNACRQFRPSLVMLRLPEARCKLRRLWQCLLNVLPHAHFLCYLHAQMQHTTCLMNDVAVDHGNLPILCMLHLQSLRMEASSSFRNISPGVGLRALSP